MAEDDQWNCECSCKHSQCTFSWCALLSASRSFVEVGVCLIFARKRASSSRSVFGIWILDNCPSINSQSRRHSREIYRSLPSSVLKTAELQATSEGTLPDQQEKFALPSDLDWKIEGGGFAG